MKKEEIDDRLMDALLRGKVRWIWLKGWMRALIPR